MTFRALDPELWRLVESGEKLLTAEVAKIAEKTGAVLCHAAVKVISEDAQRQARLRGTEAALYED